MKNILFLLTIIPFVVFGQKTKQIKNKENRETFYVLKSDHTIKHGEYRKYGYDDMLFLKGNYKQGIKDSIWECYKLDGKLSIRYDYTNDTLIYFLDLDKLKYNKYNVINSNGTMDTVLLNRPPIFMDGEGELLTVLFEELRYPKEATDNGKSGKVVVSFIVDKQGKTSEFRVKNPLGHGMDEEAIRVLKLLPDNWLPGLLNGKPVDVEYNIPIRFTLKSK